MDRKQRSARFGRLLDELREQKRQPRLPGLNGAVTAHVDPRPAATGETRVLRLGPTVYMAQTQGAGGAWVTLRRCLSREAAAAFLAERCITGRGKHAFARDLYAAYTAWCESNGEEPVKQRTFGQALREKGFDSTKERALHVWLGVTLGRDEA